ncbi:GNAT family N-acetyltransferase [Evansella tamaricis]|uniref:GNAT family N-acetyltransferase n=1 Tax=Evansella tamaricis TaxID=2069301 RepID=A0ABS6JAX2_9BACI|nr:GNAT family N-acetyltransferase [Evansella tamaricis]MBU9710334.1 GNAT family N-acetyltransferase [Evansella tamaricis]
MKIRKLTEGEMDLSIRMSEFAFQYELTDEEREERKGWLKPDQTLVVEEDGQIVSKATVLPLQTYFLGKSIAMGGVSGVVTWPENRRSGLVKTLLLECLKNMKSNGQVLSYLYPFSIPFYRKMGWELFADQQTLTLTREQLPSRKQTDGYIKRIEKNHILVDSIYQIWAKQFNGTLVRDADWWTNSTFKRKKGEVAVYYSKDHEARGYVFYQVKSRKMTVHELIWLDPESRDGLWTFISNHDSMLEKLEVTTTPAGTVPFLLEDPKIHREISSYFMARIVDVESFLSIIPFYDSDNTEPIILHITDEFCQWNDGTYFIYPTKDRSTNSSIRFFPKKASTNSSCQHAPEKGIRLSVQSLTVLLMNSQPMYHLYNEGYVKGDWKTAGRFARSYPKQEPFIYDFF